jgi:dynein heavy chain
MTGFANPQGFLTAMKQEVTRLHRAQAWALDDVAYHTEVTEWDRAEQVKAPPREGVYICGLFAEGARWDRAAGGLAESEPKKLFAPLPVLHVTTLSRAALAERRAALGPVYECPVYRYPARTGRYHVFSAALPVRGGGGGAEHWTLRGAAILCTV